MIKSFASKETERVLNISQYRLAKALHVYPRKINEIVHGKRAVTADTALRLARYFGTSAELWMNLQALYDLETGRAAVEDKILLEVKPLARGEAQATRPAG